MQGFKVAQAKTEEKPKTPPTQLLGTGGAAMAAGFLRNRKAQIDAASNYANGGVVQEQPKTTMSAPSSQALGTGMAAGAARLLSNRKAQIDAASNYKNGGVVKDYAMGGMVKGPGTGTSDDVPAMVKTGSYVMPADSTKAMGFNKGKMAAKPALGFKPKDRQVNLSNGEKVLSPDQVYAVGVKALDQMKDATHSDSGLPRSKFKFVDGGLVDEDLQKRRPTIPGMTVAESRSTPADMRQFVRDPGPGNVRVPAAGSAEANAFRQPAVQTPATVAAPAQTGGFRSAAQRALSTPAGTAGRFAGRALAPVGAVVESINVADVATNPNATGVDLASQAASGAGKLAAGYLGAKGGAALGAGLGAFGGPLAPITVPAGAVLGGVAGGIGGYMGAGKLIEQGRSMAGTDAADPVSRLPVAETASASPVSAAQAAPVQVSAPVQSQVQATTAPATSGVVNTRVQPNGVTEFSGTNISGPVTYAGGFQPRGGGVSPQNMAASDALAARSQARGAQMAAPAAQPVQEGGGNITPVTSGSGFGLLDTDARRERSLRMDAQQGVPGSAGALRALRQEVTQRPRMDADRAVAQEANEARAANDQQRTAIQQAELGLAGRQQAEAEQTGAVDRAGRAATAQSAQQQLALQNEYLTADTDEKRQSALKKLQALSGKQGQENRFTVVPGGQEVTEQGMRTVPARVFNNQTGQFVDGQGGQAVQLPPGMTKQVGTSGGKPVYEDANGKRFVGQ